MPGMPGSGSCEACAAPMGGDAFFTTAGTPVCRRCFYAEQTRLQEERVENAQNEIGLADGVYLVRGLFVGGICVLLGLIIAAASVRDGAWVDAALAVAFAAFGALVCWISLRNARQRQG